MPYQTSNYQGSNFIRSNFVSSSFLRSYPSSGPSIFTTDFTAISSLPALYTFTRASTATYYDASGILQVASTNVARFDHYPTAPYAGRGYFNEVSRQNNCLRSEDLTNAAWVKTNVTAQANQATAPDGSSNADRLTATANDAIVMQSCTNTGSIFNGSIWLSRDVGTGDVTIELGPYVTTCSLTSTMQRFNVQALAISGTYTVTAGAYTVTTAVPHGLVTGDAVRFDQTTGGGADVSVPSVTVVDPTTYTFTSGAATSSGNATTHPRTFKIRIATSGDAIFAWGGQCEIGRFMTSYIPTIGASVTRSTETLSITNLSSIGFNASQGTAKVEYELEAPSIPNNAFESYLSFNTDGSNYLELSKRDFTNGGRFQGSPLVGVTAETLSINPMGTVNKSAFTYSASGYAASNNGGAALTLGANTVPTVNKCQIGSGAVYSNATGWIRNFYYNPVQISNADLQTLTT